MGWWPFGESSFLDPEDEIWQIALWRFFLDRFGGMEDLGRSKLVLPTNDFFPRTAKQGHEKAEHIFGCVKTLARMPRWPCKLIAQPEQADVRVSDAIYLKPVTHSPAGTFLFDGEDAIISYEPSALQEPVSLIATLAHELAHYLLAGYRRDIPEGEELHEPATDILTVYMGFGVFGATTSFQYSADNSSWQWSRHGYISQRAWLYALAVFLELRGEVAELLKPHLKPHLFSDLQAAVRYLRKHRTIAAITAPVAVTE